MSKIYSRIVAVLLIIGLTATVMWAKAPRTAADEAMLQRKARYMNLEATAAIMDNELIDAHILLRNALRRDSTNPYITQQYYRTKDRLNILDRRDNEAWLGVVRQIFYLDPSDDYYADMYTRMIPKDRIDEVISIFTVLDSVHPSRIEPRKSLAYLYTLKAAEGDSTSADRMKDIYRTLRRRLPGNIEIGIDFFSSLIELGDTAAACAELSRLYAEAPADVDVLLAISRAYALTLNNSDSAMVFVDRALAVEPEAGRVHFTYANLLDMQNDSVGYDREMLTAIVAPDMEYAHKYQIIRNLLVRSQGKAQSQDRLLDSMFHTLNAMHPGEPTLHMLYGTYLSLKDDTEKAAEQFEYSVELEPENIMAWRTLLEQLASLNDEERYGRRLVDARRYFPKDYEMMIRHALYLAEDSLYTESIALMDSLMQLPVPSNISLSKVHEIRGDIYARTDSIDRAVSEYEKAIDFDSEAYMSMNNAAYFLSLRNTDLNKAALYAQMAVGSNPDNAIYLDTYAWVKFKQRDFEFALELINRALCASLNDNRPPAPDGEMPKIITVDDFDSVDSELWQLLDFDILDHAGDIYYFNGDTPRAVTFWQRALDVEPDNEATKTKVRTRSVNPDFTNTFKDSK